MFTARRLAFAALFATATVGCGGGGGGSAPLTAPKNLTYSRSIVLCARGVAIADDPASVSGSVATWSVTPKLPDGLQLDPLTGKISGTPTELSPTQPYVVRADNAVGFVETTVELGVARPARMLLAGNSIDDTLSNFVVDARSGLLRPSGYAVPTSGADYPRGMAVSRDGRVAYVANLLSDDITVYDVDPVHGRLTARANVPAAGGRVNELRMHPTADILYAIEKSAPHIETFAVDPHTGDLTSLGGLDLGSNGCEAAIVNSSGTFLFVSNVFNDHIYTLSLDRSTFLPSLASTSPQTANQPMSLALARDDRFIYTCTLGGATVEAFAVDPLTGALSKLQKLGTGLLPARVALEPTGRFLYAVVTSDNTLRTYRVDTASGLLTHTATTPTGLRPASLVIDATGSYLYTSELDAAEVGIYAIDYKTGALLRRGSLRTREQPIYLQLVPADEPAEPRSRFAFVANADSNDLSSYAAEFASGDLTEVSAALPVGGQPQAIASHPNGRWVFAARNTSQEVAAFAIDAGGQLAAIGSPLPVSAEPVDLAVDPSGRFLYAACAGGASHVDVLSIDPSSGALAALSSALLADAPSAIAIDSSGRFVVVASAAADTLTVLAPDVATGALSELVPPTVFDSQPLALAIHPSGRFVVATFRTGGRIGVLSLSAVDGALELLSTKPSGLEPTAIALDPLGRYVYVTNRDASGVGDVTSFNLDTQTEILTRVDETSAGTHPVAAAVDPSGRFLYVVNQGSNDITRLTINRNNGRLNSPVTTATGNGPHAIAIVGALE